MQREITGMTNEEMFSTILSHMDKLETSVTGLSGRMDSLETSVTGLSGRMDKLETNMEMEFRAVRVEMDVLNQSLKKDISIVNDKVDRLMYTKDVEGYENMIGQGGRK